MPSSVPIVLASHKRQIIDAVISAGLTPSDFEWEDTPSENRRGEVASSLRHKQQAFYFRLDRFANISNWEMNYCPGEESWTGKDSGDWDELLGCAKAWANYVVRELDATDYNSITMSAPKLLELPRPGEETEPLTGEEREYFSARLDEIETYLLRSRKGSREFQTQVRASLQFLREHAKKSDRRSFYALVFSTLLAVGLAFLTPAETKELIQYANTKINVNINATPRLKQTNSP